MILLTLHHDLILLITENSLVACLLRATCKFFHTLLELPLIPLSYVLEAPLSVFKYLVHSPSQLINYHQLIGQHSSEEVVHHCKSLLSRSINDYKYHLYLYSGVIMSGRISLFRSLEADNYYQLADTAVIHGQLDILRLFYQNDRRSYISHHYLLAQLYDQVEIIEWLDSKIKDNQKNI